MERRNPFQYSYSYISTYWNTFCLPFSSFSWEHQIRSSSSQRCNTSICALFDSISHDHYVGQRLIQRGVIYHECMDCVHACQRVRAAGTQGCSNTNLPGDVTVRHFLSLTRNPTTKANIFAQFYIIYTFLAEVWLFQVRLKATGMWFLGCCRNKGLFNPNNRWAGKDAKCWPPFH